MKTPIEGWYKGKCKNCKNITTWVTSKDNFNYIKKTKFPVFLQHCEHCMEDVVFELISYQSL